jgi:leishmanolysin
MESFLSRMLRVLREPLPISVHWVRDIPLVTNHFACDLVIAIAIRPFDASSTVLGSAFSHTTTSTGRTIVGGMYLNSAIIPDKIETEHSIDRFFFTLIFHELMHVLALSANSWTQWIDKRTEKHYTAPVVGSYTHPEFRKRFRILHTPALVRFVSERFGAREFWGGISAGLELEDGGGPGTAGSHPEARVYGGEVNCGIFVPYVTISNLSLAILDDTGWYEVNYSLGEPYSWGDGRSMQLRPIAEFLNGPPQFAYPKHYLCWKREQGPQCNHDFRAKGYCSPVADFKCPGNNDEVCRWRKFVNPMDFDFRGNVPEFDYLYFIVGNASQRCDDPENNDGNEFGEEFGDESMCAMSLLSRTRESAEVLPRCYRMVCVGELLIIEIENQSRICREENEKVEFQGFRGALVCPKREFICGMKNFLNGKENSMPSQMPASTRTVSSTPYPTSEGLQGFAIRVLAFLAKVLVMIFVFAGIVIIVVHVCRRMRRVDEEQNVNAEATSRGAEPRLEIPIPDEEPVPTPV